jgi:hypothetical protein
MELTYQDVIRQVEAHPDVFEFGDCVHAPSDLWLDLAQQRLQIKFPPSYVWWLKNYGGGSTFGDEIFSLYEMDFDDETSRGDIVYQNERRKKEGELSETQLLFQVSDLDLGFYFDLSEISGDGEFTVYCILTGKKYADNFAAFLLERIKDA